LEQPPCGSGGGSIGHFRSHSAVIDAALCFPGSDGAPDFFRLLKAAFSNRGSEHIVYAFDLLHLNGRDLAPLPLIERRELLERLPTPT
jgi:bifunctional non-homologous end joining protein LigD